MPIEWTRVQGHRALALGQNLEFSTHYRGRSYITFAEILRDEKNNHTTLCFVLCEVMPVFRILCRQKMLQTDVISSTSPFTEDLLKWAEDELISPLEQLALRLTTQHYCVQLA